MWLKMPLGMSSERQGAWLPKVSSKIEVVVDEDQVVQEKDPVVGLGVDRVGQVPVVEVVAIGEL